MSHDPVSQSSGTPALTVRQEHSSTVLSVYNNVKYPWFISSSQHNYLDSCAFPGFYD